MHGRFESRGCSASLHPILQTSAPPAWQFCSPRKVACCLQTVRLQRGQLLILVHRSPALPYKPHPSLPDISLLVKHKVLQSEDHHLSTFQPHLPAVPANMPPPPTALQWDQHRELITDLYIKQGKTQEEVAAYMLEEHGFRASEKMFVSRFIKWAINKKMSVKDARAILHAVGRRNGSQRRVLKLRLRGREVTEQEARTSLKRRKLEIIALDHSTPGPSTPSDISVVDQEDRSLVGSIDVVDEQFSGTLANASVDR